METACSSNTWPNFVPSIKPCESHLIARTLSKISFLVPNISKLIHKTSIQKHPLQNPVKKLQFRNNYKSKAEIPAFTKVNAIAATHTPVALGFPAGSPLLAT